MGEHDKSKNLNASKDWHDFFGCNCFWDHQPPTAHNRIQKTCEQRGQGDENPFHGWIFAPHLLLIWYRSAPWFGWCARKTGKKKGVGITSA